MIGFGKVNNDFKPQLDTLDETQLAAVTSEERNVLIKAPAGAGKTTCLISAITNYRYNYINDKICAITYTRAARAEMEERLQTIGIYDVNVNTIHTWSRDQLDYFAKKYDFRIHIMQEAQIKSILRDIVKDYLVRSKVKSVNIDILYNFITGNKLMDVTDNYRRTLIALEKRYIQFKREQHLYDFTDYPLYLWDVLTIYNETIQGIDALFVDEFQDVDMTQFDIFEKVICKKKFYIGDSWQSIFVFRGADGEVFDKLDKFKKYKLKYNYRSYQQIIDFASTIYLSKIAAAQRDDDCGFILDNPVMEESSIICARGSGVENIVSCTSDYFGTITWDDNEQDFVEIGSYDFFTNFMQNEPMILCRTNKQVKAIQENNYFNVSTIHQAKGLEYKNVIVIDWNIKGLEDLNVAYVALTRARDKVYIINWSVFETLFEKWLTRR